MFTCARTRLAGIAVLLWSTAAVQAKNITTVPIASSGTASLTRYDFPLGSFGACACNTNSTYYPTAALSQSAFGSSVASGPACGQCFNLTLLQTVFAEPPWVLEEEQRKSVVVKVTDKCPAGGGKIGEGWCGGTEEKKNKANQTYHFDLSTPSPSIPLSFFPTNESFYGYSDFGAWLIHFEQVSCEEWEGWTNETVLGLDPSLTSESGCCPANPLVDNDVCPAFSLKASATPLFSPSLLAWSTVLAVGTALLVV
ncbi:hypothetical protein JCM8547_007585 [Rhodosporidiobolus lusitaniae]